MEEKDKENQDFEKAFKDKFSEWETAPPADALAKVQVQLQKKTSLIDFKKNKYLWIFLFLLIGSYMSIHFKISNQKNSSQISGNENKPERLINQPPNNQELLDKKGVVQDTDKNVESTVNQLITKSESTNQNTNNKLQTNENQPEIKKQNKINNFDKNSQIIDNQVVIIDSKKDDLRKNQLQNIENQLVRQKINKIDSSYLISQDFDNQLVIKNNTNKALNQNKTQTTDNQIVIENGNKLDSGNFILQDTDNQLITKDNPYKDSNNHKTQTLDNQLITKNLEKFNSTSENSQSIDNQQNRQKFQISKINPLDSLLISEIPDNQLFTDLRIDYPKNRINPPKKWFAQLNFGPTFTYKLINSNREDTVFIENFNTTKGFKTSNVGWQANLQLSRTINQNLEFFGGLGYAQYRTRIEYFRQTISSKYTLVAIDENSFLYIPTITSDTISKQFSESLIQLELGGAYKIIKCRVPNYLRLSGGLNLTKRPSIFGKIAYQLLFNFNQKWHLSIEPHFNYRFQNQSFDEGAFKNKNYYLGIQTGLRFSF